MTPKFALIVCTYMRPGPLAQLLESVRAQRSYPDQIVIIDGSRDQLTGKMLQQQHFANLEYYLVSDADRGLTRQRNFGIRKLASDIEIVCFLDDDIVLEPGYFENLLQTYNLFPEALGVGGYILDEAQWIPAGGDEPTAIDFFVFDGWKRPEPLRFRLRRRFGLDSDVAPGFSPEFSHGRSIGFLPPSGKIYPVNQLMGGVSSFRKSVFDQFSFSTFFEGYGLYEDADFTLRVSKAGPLYVNTAAWLRHYHDPLGRPNQFRYGKMVVRNGFYVWRVAHGSPSFKSRLKWHAITLLLTGIRLANAVTGPARFQALTETAGRFSGWASVLIDPPYPKQEAPPST